MDKLQQYLDGQYKEDSARRDELIKQIRIVLPLFTDTFNVSKYGWPYEYGKAAKSLSRGTVAMTAAALQHVVNADVPKSIFDGCRYKKQDGEAAKEEKTAVEEVVKAAIKLIDPDDLFSAEDYSGKTHQPYSSSTYGKNSVFVLAWICDLLHQDYLGKLQAKSDTTKQEALTKQHQDCIRFLANDRIQEILPRINDPDEIRYYDEEEEVKSASPAASPAVSQPAPEPAPAPVPEPAPEPVPEPAPPAVSLPDSKREYVKDHAFPLSKALQMYEMYQPSMDEADDAAKSTLKKLEAYLLRKLHHCISLASLENSQFDAAELVFSLESFLIVRSIRLASKDRPSEETASFLCDKAILEKVFSILTEKQELNQYWRPLKPFLTKPQGYALLPISVEITQSLLRICKRLGKIGEKLFAEHSDIFEHYFDWIKSRITAVDGKYGWSSEHIYRSDVIHIWQSSQVLQFLTDYYIFLRRKIAADALAAANLSVTYPKKQKPEKKTEEAETPEPAGDNGRAESADSGRADGSKNKANKPTDFWKTEPYGSDQVHKKIKKMIEASKNDDKAEQSVSFLLYGPPGTGKTYFAEQISKLKQWPLLSLSPSNFIASGVDQLEYKAKNLFAVLCEQHDLVIIFDEIDRLMLNRDSEDYKNQDDMFQVMVASLLVKFKALRETPHIVFLICTNYKHRLDPALIRPGRIDRHILIMPPDQTGREEHITEYLSKNNKKLPSSISVKDIAKETPLFSYGELDQLVDDCCDADPSDTLIKLLDTHKSTISLSAYLQHIYKYEKGKEPGETKRVLRPASELPLDEIFMTAYALYETGHLKQQNDEDKNNLKELAESEGYEAEASSKVGAVMGDTVKGKVEAMIKYIKSEYKNLESGEGGEVG